MAFELNGEPRYIDKVEKLIHVAGDGGGALGAALYAYHCLLGKPRQFVMDHAAWGAEYSASESRAFLQSRGVAFEEMADEDRLIDRVVDALQEGKVIGWFQGRFEWGPRALGQRSILADPRRVDMKDIVNTKIKFREPYRPFAPSVTAAAAPEFFALHGSADQYPHRFMLYVVDVKPEMAGRLPATTHVDGTARVQIVHADVTPRYHALIDRFGQATGVPVLLNTSFNLKGEPIVASPADAWRSFARCDMDMLVLGEFIVDKDRVGRRRG